jgi:nicotinamidase/pyrazinamidase
MKLGEGDALLVVDVQVDFCPGGALPVPEGDRVVPALNKYIALFKARGLPVVATRDWHPPNHISFKARGGPWPPHCVQETRGAEFHPELQLPSGVMIVSKADKPDQEAYSGFQGTGLAEWLRARGVRRVFVGGLATDYCVRATVLDALKAGFEAVLLLDASRGVDVNPGDSERAVREMVAAGAKTARLEELE